jgi:hypothetical protein
MEYRLQVAGISRETGRESRVTLKFNAEGELLNAIALAKSSLIGWGEWQQSHKVKSAFGKCWWCSTAGHGGFILVTQEPIGFREPAFETHYAFPTGPAVKVYAYEFEEDCDWSLLLEKDPQAFESEIDHMMTQESNAGKTREAVKETLRCEVLSARHWQKMYEAREKAKNEMLEAGRFLRCSAKADDDDRVHVLFENKEGKRIGYYMSRETYHSIPLLVPATPEDFANHDKIEPAPGEF